MKPSQLTAHLKDVDRFTLFRTSKGWQASVMKTDTPGGWRVSADKCPHKAISKLFEKPTERIDTYGLA